MRVTEKVFPHEVERIPHRICFEHIRYIAQIFDNSFENSHFDGIYEHERYKYDDIFYNGTLDNLVHRNNEIKNNSNLAEEEIDILSLVKSIEVHRLLKIVGDVGVGKSTFLQHIIGSHFNTDEFEKPIPFYIDWKGFSPSSIEDPLPSIRKKFAQYVYKSFEERFTREKLIEIDYMVFDHDILFANDRSALLHVSSESIEDIKSRKIIEKIDNEYIDFAIARLRTLGRENRNYAIIIMDNLDQIYLNIYKHIVELMVHLREETPFLIIVAMRDHTYHQSSMFERENIIQPWKMRLCPPNIKSTISRRINYFFPKIFDSSKHTDMFSRQKNVSIDICRSLSLSPIYNTKSYNFIAKWSNYNIREVFSTILHIISYHGLPISRNQNRIINGDPIDISMDDCIIALALGDYELFYPDRSKVFNPYYHAFENQKLGLLSAVRMMQYLYQSRDPIKCKEIIDYFSSLGYPIDILNLQILTMLNKDVIWSDTGPVDDFKTDKSSIRLSYRGRLYLEILFRRTTYNYIISYNIDVPKTNTLATVKRDDLRSFSDLSELLDVDSIANRLISLVKIIHEAELLEFKTIAARRSVKEFRALVSPNNIALCILDGFESYLNKALKDNDFKSRIRLPSNIILEEISEVKNEIKSKKERVME